MIDEFLWGPDQLRMSEPLTIDAPHGGDEAISRQMAAKHLRSFRSPKPVQTSINQRCTLRWRSLGDYRDVDYLIGAGIMGQITADPLFWSTGVVVVLSVFSNEVEK